MDDNPTPTNDANLTLGWGTFADRLTTLLGALIESEEGHDNLYLGLPVQDPRFGAGPAVMLTRTRDGYLKMEIGDHDGLDPEQRVSQDLLRAVMGEDALTRDDSSPYPYVEGAADTIGQLACIVVDLFKDVYGIPLPGLLAYAGHGPSVDAAAVLGLTRLDQVPTDIVPGRSIPAEMGTVHHFVTRGDLTSLVGELLHGRFDEVESVDGEFHLRHEGHQVVIRARPDQPAVEIVTRLIHGVRARHIALTEIDILNRDSIWTKFVLRDRDVFMDINVPAMPYAENHLHEMLSVFLEAIDSSRDDLALRTGGRVG